MIPFTVMLLATALQATPSARPAPDSGRVSGHWQFDEQESDNPRSQMSERDSAAGASGEQPGDRGYRRRGGGGGGDFGGGFGGRGGGMEGGGGGGERTMSSGDRAARQRLMQLVFRAPQQVELIETDTSFTIIGAEADSIALRTNGRKLERRGDDGVKIEYRARRRDGRLEVERQVGNAGRLTETWFMSPRGGQLFVLVHLLPSNGRGEMTFRRIYEPATTAP